MTTALPYHSGAASRRPTTAEFVVLGLVMFAATIDFARGISVFGVSGLGAECLIAAGLLWATWLTRPVLSHSVLRPLLPLILFNVDAAGTRLWSSTGMDGTQLQVIGLEFLGIIVLCARESAQDPAFAARVQKFLLWSSAVAVVASMYESATTGAEEDGSFVGRRAFALYAMPVVAAALAGWRGAADKRSAYGHLGWALVTTAAVAFTQSRTALVCCLILFPMSIALRMNRKSVATSLVITVAVAAAFTAVIFSYQPLYDRFFANDAAIKVGGVAINASGRTKIWDLVLSSVGSDWIFGKGVATSMLIVRAMWPNIGQPHNDYLRFYCDQGVVGLGIWVIFCMAFFQRAFRDLLRSIRLRTIDYQTHIAAIMAFTAVLISYATDNTCCYGFVMIPLGALIGTSLGAGSRLDLASNPADEWDMAENPQSTGVSAY